MSGDVQIVEMIQTSGKWYVMHRCEDSPETCQAVRIAAWARVGDPVYDGNEYEIHPLIASLDPGSTNMLVIPDAEQVVGICDEEGTRDPNWQDIAKQSAECARDVEDREEATEERARAGLDNMAKKFPDLGPQAISKVLEAIKLRRAYLHNPDEIHALIECDFIEAGVGYYKLKPLGEIAIKLLAIHRATR